MLGQVGRRAGASGVRAQHMAVLQQTRGFAENLKDIQMRITSTQNIQKITASMKMVSAAKLRGDQERLEQGRPFGKSMSKIFDATPAEDDVALPEAKKPLYVVLSSDRGLCGGVNSYATKAAKLACDEDVAKGLEPAIFVVGDKGHGPLMRTHGDFVLGQIMEPWKQPMNFGKALIIADHIKAARPDADAIRIVYNRFQSAIVYHTEVKSCANFPVLSGSVDENNTVEELPFPLYKYEGELESTEEGLQNLFDFALTVQLYGCLIENATSEQSSRMAAMDNASNNAQAMVDSLTLKYNRARQAKITTELIEIISGAESLKS